MEDSEKRLVIEAALKVILRNCESDEFVEIVSILFANVIKDMLDYEQESEYCFKSAGISVKTEVEVAPEGEVLH